MQGKNEVSVFSGYCIFVGSINLAFFFLTPPSPKNPPIYFKRRRKAAAVKMFSSSKYRSRSQSGRSKAPKVELSAAQIQVRNALKIPGVKIPHLAPLPRIEDFIQPLSDTEKALLKFRLSKQKGKQVQKLV